MTNEPNGIGLTNIQHPEPARFAESDTEFGERMRNR